MNVTARKLKQLELLKKHLIVNKETCKLELSIELDSPPNIDDVDILLDWLVSDAALTEMIRVSEELGLYDY